MLKEGTAGRVFDLLGAISGIALAVGWAVFRSGTDTVFQLHTDALRAANWPNPDLPSEEAYTRMSVIGPWLYKLIGGDSDVKYLALSVGAAMASVILLSLWCAINVPLKQRLRAVRLVILAPVVAMMATQIGNYDPFTVLGIGCLLFAWSSGKKVLLLAAGIYLGLQHFEQSVMGILVLGSVVLFAQDWLPPKLRGLPSPFWALAGVVIGKLGLSLVLILNQVSFTDGRASWISDPELLRISIVGSINFLPALLMSFFAGAWAIVLISGASGMQRSAQIIGLVTISVTAIIAVITLDHTRVFVLMTLPLLTVVTVGLLNRWPKDLSTKTVYLVEAFAWLIVPVALYTSPDGPTFLKDLNVADHFLMMSHFALNMSSG